LKTETETESTAHMFNDVRNELHRQ